MRTKSGVILLAGLLLTSLIARADGELMVMPATTKLFNAYPKAITVRNTGDAPLYLSVMLQKVMNPGMNREKKVSLRDLPNPGVLATPEKMTLGPNQTREIRLTSLVEPVNEEVYRLYITPVRSFSVENAPQDKITAPMSVSVGYGVLVRHMPPPAKQKASWTHHCENGHIILENTGNVRVRLSDITITPDNAGHASAIGLFPGTPQPFKASKITMKVNEQPAVVSCP